MERQQGEICFFNYETRRDARRAVTLTSATTRTASIASVPAMNASSIQAVGQLPGSSIPEQQGNISVSRKGCEGCGMALNTWLCGGSLSLEIVGMDPSSRMPAIYGRENNG